MRAPDDPKDATIWYKQMEQGVKRWDSEPASSLKISTLGDYVFRFGLRIASHPDARWHNVYEYAQVALLSNRGHAQHFGNRIRRAYEPLKGPNPAHAIHHARQEMMYGFATLKHLPSPENVKVLGEMLSDTWRMPRYGPASLALSAITGALEDLPLRDPPKKRSAMAWESSEVVNVPQWQAWYEELKSGRKTFSFKGQKVEYRFKPDGTWETLALANPPDDGSPEKPAASLQSNKQPAQNKPATNATWPWIILSTMLLIGGIVWFAVQHDPRGGHAS